MKDPFDGYDAWKTAYPPEWDEVDDVEEFEEGNIYEDDPDYWKEWWDSVE